MRLGLRIPNSRSSIIGCRYDAASIWAEGCLADAMRMPAQYRYQCLSFRVQYVRSCPRTRSAPRSVRLEAGAIYSLPMPSQGANIPSCRNIPDACGGVVRCRYDAVASGLNVALFTIFECRSGRVRPSRRALAIIGTAGASMFQIRTVKSADAVIPRVALNSAQRSGRGRRGL